MLFLHHLEQNTTAGKRKIYVRTKEVMGTETSKEASANAASPPLSIYLSLSPTLPFLFLSDAFHPLSFCLSAYLSDFTNDLFQEDLTCTFAQCGEFSCYDHMLKGQVSYETLKQILAMFSCCLFTQEPAYLKVSPLFLATADGGFFYQ